MTETKPGMARCQAMTKARKPCHAAPTEGGLCFFHANPKMASELGRKGGRSRKKRQPPSEEVVRSLPALDNMTAVRELNNRLIEKVYSGHLDGQCAKSIASLVDLQSQLLEVNSYGAEDAQSSSGDTYFEVIEADWLKEKKEKLAEELEKKYADQFPKGDTENDKNKAK